MAPDGSFPPMRAIRIEEWGGPEVLALVDDAERPVAGPDDVLVRVTLAGVNFADTHQSGNQYVARFELPFTPGAEVAGVVEADAHGFRAGERVVAMTAAGGGYAEWAAVPAARCVRVPDGVSDAAALALLLQGLTAWHVLVTCGRLTAGESVVVTSGAGGVGSLLVQLARSLGAGTIVGTASSQEKRDLVLELGADAAIETGLAEAEGADGGHGPLRDAVLEATDGRGADVIAEMAGGAVFDQLFESLAPLGRLVVYGISSREQNDVRTGRLLKHSRSLIGLWLYHLLGDPRHVGPPLRGPLRAARPRRAARRGGRDLPPLGGPPRARGPQGPPHERQAHARPERLAVALAGLALLAPALARGLGLARVPPGVGRRVRPLRAPAAGRGLVLLAAPQRLLRLGHRDGRGLRLDGLARPRRSRARRPPATRPVELPEGQSERHHEGEEPERPEQVGVRHVVAEGDPEGGEADQRGEVGDVAHRCADSQAPNVLMSK